jgi:hypothetical protein
MRFPFSFTPTIHIFQGHALTSAQAKQVVREEVAKLEQGRRGVAVSPDDVLRAPSNVLFTARGTSLTARLSLWK